MADVTAEPTTAISEYLERVDTLFAQAAQWLRAIEPADQFRRTSVQIVEESTGPYNAHIFEVSRGDAAALRLVPRGRYMLGASGRVDIRSRLGSEMLVWVAAGGPAIGFKVNIGAPVTEVRGRPIYTDVLEGWAWVDQDRRALVHLTRELFQTDLLGGLS